ncbi:prepilin-type N-terminal cleavage/methylation domain-containing protein, partial [Candidatus Peregrinibacteria bacterium]|nr:prepilin-type N-terminal cleavage/methylation domain-containing protein [Candidatus Peregrinibacteria bacterium]
MMLFKTPKVGFTLIEMIIAIGLVGAISAISAAALINIMKTEKTSAMHQSIAEDGRIILDLLASEIKNNAIDYEEYYNTKKFGYDFGKNYGEYGKQFYDDKDNPTGKIFDTAINYSAKQCGEGHLALISPNGME